MREKEKEQKELAKMSERPVDTETTRLTRHPWHNQPSHYETARGRNGKESHLRGVSNKTFKLCLAMHSTATRHTWDGSNMTEN
jgi:hypothetical protein